MRMPLNSRLSVVIDAVNSSGGIAVPLLLKKAWRE